MAATEYAFLDSAEERAFLIGLAPETALANAHRFYAFMAEQGLPAESFIRELAFEKASEALGIDYDVLYEAWLSQVPAPAQIGA